MTKKQVVWLLIKLIGVWFAYSAITAVPGVIGSVYNYASLPSPPRFAKAESANNSTMTPPGFPSNPTINNPSATPKIEPENPLEKAKNEALKLFLWNLFSTLFYGLIGWYLIRDGRFLFAILNRENPFGDAGEPTETGAPSVSRKKDEVVTTLNLSGGKKDEITSLNLSGSANTPVEPTPASSVAPENTPDEAQVEETPAFPNSSVSTVERPEESTVIPAETQENALLEIPEDESIDERKY